MTDRVEGRLHEIMEAAAVGAGHEPGDLTGKVGAFYKSFMDEARIEQLGATPLDPDLTAIREAKTLDALAALTGHAAETFNATLFSFYIDVDLKDPGKYALYLNQSGLGLPDRDYYLKTISRRRRRPMPPMSATR